MLGKGKIEWKRLLKYIKGKSYIFEICLEDQTNCIEMLLSYEYLKHLNKKEE